MTCAAPAGSSLDAQRETLRNRIQQGLSGAFDLFGILLGDRAGLYKTLATRPPMTPAQLAAATATDPARVRAWLDQQTEARFVVAEPGGRYTIDAAAAEILADPDSLRFLAPLPQRFFGAALMALAEGAGVPNPSEGHARMGRAAFLGRLSQEWIPAMPGLRERLSAPGARAVDFGCGAGWAAIGLALGFPGLSVDGFDLHAGAVETAWANARGYGLTDRVHFHHRDAGDPALTGRYDLALAIECAAESANPAAVLRSMRRVLRGGGMALIAEPAAGWERAGWRMLGAGGEVDLPAAAREAGFREVRELSGWMDGFDVLLLA
ncbi:MAG: class I SAM-dependent methyltransferase [Bryobacteraceae bacterium]